MLSGRCHAPREEDEHPCMVVWHLRTSALSMMERLATALSKRNVLFALVSCVSMHLHGCRSPCLASASGLTLFLKSDHVIPI